MKKIALSLCALFLALSASYGLAETGGGTMKDNEGKSSRMMEHKGMMKEGAMSHDEMMGHMTDMMGHMSEMMGKMSGMMKTMPKEKMGKMHKMMDEMVAQIKHMDKMMKMGAGSEKEMKMMQDRQKRMDKMIEELQTQ